MSCYQKIVSTFPGKKAVLLLTAAFFTLTSMTPHRANFSGEWKLNESKTEDGNFLCIYDMGDRMRSETMKIAEQADFLTVEVPNSSPDAALVTSQEKLTFDGKENEVNHIGRGKKFTVKWSGDGQTMTVNSVVYCDIDGKKEEFKVTEIWKLINEERSISVRYDLESTLIGERVMKRVYDKVN